MTAPRLSKPRRDTGVVMLMMPEILDIGSTRCPLCQQRQIYGRYGQIAHSPAHSAPNGRRRPQQLTNDVA
jgi:hypothetical protein